MTSSGHDACEEAQLDMRSGTAECAIAYETEGQEIAADGEATRIDYTRSAGGRGARIENNAQIVIAGCIKSAETGGRRPVYGTAQIKEQYGRVDNRHRTDDRRVCGRDRHKAKTDSRDKRFEFSHPG